MFNAFVTKFNHKCNNIFVLLFRPMHWSFFKVEKEFSLNYFTMIIGRISAFWPLDTTLGKSVYPVLKISPNKFGTKSEPICLLEDNNKPLTNKLSDYKQRYLCKTWCTSTVLQ